MRKPSMAALQTALVYRQYAAPAASRPRVRRPAPAGLRPERLLAAWGCLAALMVGASAAYLSLMVHAVALGRTLAAMEEQLKQERRRAGQLEAALARALSPEATEQMARQLLAMERPSRVEPIVVARPPAAERGALDVAAAGGAGGTRGRQAGGQGLAGLWMRFRAAWEARVGDGLAMARRLPQWP